MKEVLRQLLTGKDNATYDLARVTWLFGFVAVIVLAGYEVTKGNVNLRELAEALGIVSGASGAATMMKKDTEPQ